MAPLTDIPNAADKAGQTPIHIAASFGYTEIIKFLVPLADNHNAPDKNGQTPTHVAARHRHFEIVNILNSKTYRA